MDVKLKLHTQGVSDDWLTADGDFTTKFRGALDENQIRSALQYIAALGPPAGDSACPPRTTIESATGQLIFTGTGASLLLEDKDIRISPENATALALGRIALEDLRTEAEVTAPPPPVSAPPPPVAVPDASQKRCTRKAPSSRQRSAAGRRQPQAAKARKAAGILGAITGAALGSGIVGGTEAATTMATGAAVGAAAASDGDGPQRATGRVRRRFMWRQYVSFVLSGGFIIGGIVSIAGAVSMADRGKSSDDTWAALIIAGMLLLIGFVWIYASVKQAPRVDGQGNRVDADGNILMGVTMAHMIAMDDAYDSDSYDDDGDFGGD